mmetsp:Transcript_53889/g.114491  ORF Transcript_53889/g.114491 Transcript_53889/m.114491 type:complete len:641 (+) Transcript_53889:280-2202(+)
MANNYQSIHHHHDQLAAHLMGVLAGTSDSQSATASAAPAPATFDAIDKHQLRSHVVSAANSVASSKSSAASLAGNSGAPSSQSNTAWSDGGGGASRAASVAAAPAPVEHKNEGSEENAAAGAAGPSAPPPAPVVSSGIDTMAMQMNAPPHPVAEFLFQLTKMLTDSNAEYIEWRNASIFVHDPPGLEKDILPKYFRHSNYSSFQRQMNYFGFRKIAGKGKMAPCSYVNEAAKEDISSLLFIKRKKTGVSSAAAKLMAQQNRINRSLGVAALGLGGGGGLGGGLGVGGGNSLMGGALPGASQHANSSLTFNNTINNISMMGGATTGNNMVSSASSGAAGLTGTNNLLSPQDMLAQLQQAHAAALMNSQAPNTGMGGGAGGVHQAPQAAQNKALNNLGLGMTNNGNGSANTVFLTNDQGNVYSNSSHNPTDWSNPTDAAAAQSLLIQQATQAGLSGNFSQLTQAMAGGGNNGTGDSNGMVRLDSAANLRALINQQISMFSNPPAAGDLASAMSALGAAVPPGAPAPSAGINQPQAQGPAGQHLSGLNYLSTGNAGQALGQGFDWNEMIQRMGGGACAENSAAGNASASLQQLLQCSPMLQGVNNGAPGPAPAGQSFNFNGLFGMGGGASAPQGSLPPGSLSM